jgi:hypothetical protein
MYRFLFLPALLFIASCTMGPSVKDGMTFGSSSGKTGKAITVRFDRGENFIQIKKMGLMKMKIRPQIAVWMEDTLGKYLGTVYVTSSFGKQKWMFYKPKADSCFRPMCMPYWLNRSIAAGNAAPTPAHPLPDAVTGATPTGGFSIDLIVPDSVRIFKLFTEWNRSYDNNETFPWKKSSFNGQPSVVFCGRVNLMDSARFADTLKLVGRGGETGNDGKLYNDTDKLTTALTVFEKVVAIRVRGR